MFITCVLLCSNEMQASGGGTGVGVAAQEYAKVLTPFFSPHTSYIKGQKDF